MPIKMTAKNNTGARALSGSFPIRNMPRLAASIATKDTVDVADLLRYSAIMQTVRGTSAPSSRSRMLR